MVQLLSAAYACTCLWAYMHLIFTFFNALTIGHQLAHGWLIFHGHIWGLCLVSHITYQYIKNFYVGVLPLHLLVSACLCMWWILFFLCSCLLIGWLCGASNWLHTKTCICACGCVRLCVRPCWITESRCRWEGGCMFKGPVIGSYRADVSWAIIFFWLPAVLIQTVLLHFRYRTKHHELDSFNKKYKYINA